MIFDSKIDSNVTFLYKKNNIEVYIKREDLLHEYISGNKFRKLKYNILEAKKQNKKTLLTFGGAFSNHITATAYAGKLFGFKTIGIIRGNELAKDLEKTLATNPSLQFATKQGMQFEFISRTEYRNKTTPNFIKKLQTQFGDFYLIPEGGTNQLAIKGCSEILTEKDTIFNNITVAVGTGGTIAGIVNSSKKHQKIIGFPALKGDFLKTEIEKLTNKKFTLINEFHFGGFAKINEELIRFINNFKEKYSIALDPIYTGKMFFAIDKLIQKGYFTENSKILAIHTGGLQGIKAMNSQLIKKKKLSLLTE